MSNTYYLYQLDRMNNDYETYGSRWISNIHTLNENSNTKYRLYALGDCNLSGRKYIALPANQKLSNHDIEKYNIIDHDPDSNKTGTYY